MKCTIINSNATRSEMLNNLPPKQHTIKKNPVSGNPLLLRDALSSVGFSYLSVSFDEGRDRLG